MNDSEMRPDGAGPSGRGRAPALWKAGGILVLGAGLFFLARQGAHLIPQALEAVRGLGPWAAVAFIGLYAVAAVAWVPGSVLTLASGAIFGLAWGTLLTLIGATLGASLAFLVSRYLARAALERRIGNDPRLTSMDKALGREGARLIFLLRLSPVFPFNLMNYALGLTAVRFRDYVLASAVGMAPGTFMYVYAGFAAGQVAMSAGGAGQRGAAGYATLAVGLLATIAVTVFVTRIARRALRSASGLEGGTGGGKDGTGGGEGSVGGVKGDAVRGDVGNSPAASPPEPLTAIGE